MDIWEILGIEPTTDKRAIKKAYAAQSKIIHPEEKPDEFRILYEAYQMALKWGQNADRQDILKSVEKPEKSEKEKKKKAEEKKDIPKEQKEEEENLISYFRINFKNKEKSISNFKEYWGKIGEEPLNPILKQRWREYLLSQEFKKICRNPEILQMLAEDIGKKSLYEDEWKLILWEVYGFEEYEEEEYEGNLKKIKDSLYPVYYHEKQEKLAKQWKKKREREEREKKQKAKKKFRKIIFMLFLTVCAVIFLWKVWEYHGIKKEQQTVLAYMTEKYPETEFQVLKGEKIPTGYTYLVSSSSHPEFPITVDLKNKIIDISFGKIDKSYDISDNCTIQLLEYYVAQYGIRCAELEIPDRDWFYISYYADGPGAGTSARGRSTDSVYVLYYPKIEEIDDFLDIVSKVFREQDELKHIKEVGICAEDIRFPEVLLNGGVNNFFLTDRQIYSPYDTDKESVKDAMEKAYIIYMFNYEPWRITSDQYAQWGKEYEKICKELEKYDGSWHTFHTSGKESFQLYIPVFVRRNYSDYRKLITVGNVYHYLRSKGTDIVVRGDGLGFFAEYEGETYFYGSILEVHFNEIEKWE